MRSFSSTCVSCSRPRLDRASYPVRHEGAGCHSLQGYRAIVDLAPIAAISLFYCNCTDRRAVHGRCMPAPPWPTTLVGDNWTMAGRRLSPYRSRASPRRNLPALTNSARPSLSRAALSESQFLQCGCTTRLPRTTRSKTNDPQCPSAT